MSVYRTIGPTLVLDLCQRFNIPDIQNSHSEAIKTEMLIFFYNKMLEPFDLLGKEKILAFYQLICFF